MSLTASRELLAYSTGGESGKLCTYNSTMPQLLVSFFNQLLTPKFSLGVLDSGSGEFRWLDLQADQGISGCAGLASRRDRVFVAAQAGGTGRLQIYAMPEFKLLSVYELRHTQAVHSLLAIDDGRILGVGTGNDEIYEYVVVSDEVVEERLFWRLPGTHPGFGDQWHVNSIAPLGDGFAVSYMAHALPSNDDYQSGGIFSLADGELLATGLKCPHSLMNFDGRLYVAHNPGMISEVGGESGEVGGFARGLCRTGSSLFVGASGHRWQSRSTQRAYIDQYEDFVAQGAKVVQVSLEGFDVILEFDLRGLGIEVFEVTPVCIDPRSEYLMPGDPVVERACALEFVAAGYHQAVEVDWKV
ncbi:MAG: hypothetical protein DCC49_07775 [Acidobacteria bacterium]|nr:MAG: hypothetical protein DCC49_07775 [Acidobacteriota bacterium]